MDKEESKQLMDAILGGFQEQRAVLEGLKLEVAHLTQRMTAVEERLGSVEVRLGSVEGRLDSVEGRLGAVEQGLVELRQEVRTGLVHLGERWLEHDREIYALKHRQA
ncbi:MAG: hypothetical protein ACM3ZA_01870 [Bacillota bacterium]